MITELVSKMLLPNYPTSQDYAVALKEVENEITEIRRRLARPAEELITLEELMASLRTKQATLAARRDQELTPRMAS